MQHIWDNILSIVGCGIPAFSDFGSVGSNLTTYESTANYSCDTGYNLTGSMTRTCGGNGNWSGTAPTCSLKSNKGLHLILI